MATSAVANAETVLGAAVANAATFTVPYPAGYTQATLTNTTNGEMALKSGERFKQAASGAGTVLFTFGASNITVTNNSGVALAAGAKVYLSFGEVDINGSYNLTTPKKVQTFVNAQASA